MCFNTFFFVDKHGWLSDLSGWASEGGISNPGCKWILVELLQHDWFHSKMPQNPWVISLPAFSPKMSFTGKRSRFFTKREKDFFISKSARLVFRKYGLVPWSPPKKINGTLSQRSQVSCDRAKRYAGFFRGPWPMGPPLEISLGNFFISFGSLGGWHIPKAPQDLQQKVVVSTEARSGMIQQVGRRWRVKRQNWRKMVP